MLPFVGNLFLFFLCRGMCASPGCANHCMFGVPLCVLMGPVLNLLATPPASYARCTAHALRQVLVVQEDPKFCPLLAGITACSCRVARVEPWCKCSRPSPSGLCRICLLSVPCVFEWARS